MHMFQAMPALLVEPAFTYAPLEAAVLQAIVYADVFDYALTVPEIQRYLVGMQASLREVEHAVEALTPQLLQVIRGFVVLEGREHSVETRVQRAAHAALLWPKAQRYGRLISDLPFVRMVAITGALAVDNVQPGADIDYLIVTEPGRLWLCRAVIIALVRLAQRRGDVVCPNYLISERALVLQERNLYTAHELTQMVPISGQTAYTCMRRLNAWTQQFLPNAIHAPRAHAPLPPRMRLARNLAEAGLRTPLGAHAERWEMGRKIPEAEPAPHTRHGNSILRRLVQGPFRGPRPAHARCLPCAVAGDRSTGRAMIDILFGQSYYLRFDPKLWEAMQPYPPLGTLYAASLMRARGYTVALFDAMLADSEAEWQQALAREQPRFAVIYEDNFNYLSKNVPRADARSRFRDDRHGESAWLHRDHRRIGCERPRRCVPCGRRRCSADRRGRGDAGRTTRAAGNRRAVTT